MNIRPLDFWLPPLPWPGNNLEEFERSAANRWFAYMGSQVGAGVGAMLIPATIFFSPFIIILAPFTAAFKLNKQLRDYHTNVQIIFNNHIKRIDEIEKLALEFLRILNSKAPEREEERNGIARLQGQLSAKSVPCLESYLEGKEYFTYHQEANTLRSQIWALHIQKVQKLTDAVFRATAELRASTESSSAPSVPQAINLHVRPLHPTFLYNSPALGRRDANEDELEIHCMMKKDQRRVAKTIILACGAPKPNANPEKMVARAAKRAKDDYTRANQEERRYQLYLHAALEAIQGLQEKKEEYRMSLEASNLAMQFSATRAEVNSRYDPRFATMNGQIAVLARNWANLQAALENKQ